MRPLVGATSPESTLSSVDFPAPDGPTTATSCPGRRSSETPPTSDRRPPGDRDAVDQRRVPAAQVGQPPRPADAFQPGVTARDLEVTEHDVVVGGPAARDPHPVADPHAGQPDVVGDVGPSPGRPRSTAVPSR